MATWGSYLGLGKRAEPAPTPVVAQSEDVSEKFEIRPFDPSSIYGGKGAENTIVEPIIKATVETQPGFIRGSRRTQSDSTIPQPPPTIAPRRTQSNASRVARLFGYRAPVEEDPQVEKILTGPTDPEPKPRVSQEQVIPVVQRTPEEENAGTARRAAFRNIVKVATQPKMLKVVDEAIEQEEERKFLEFERISEQIRMEKEAMEAERDKMFQAQEKMRIELERMAQEEAEMFEYCKIMGIEEPRPLKKVMIEEPPPVKVDDSEFKASKERERLLQIRRERQQELDREIERQEAKRLEEEQLALKEVETLDSESEYEDEYIDDEEDDIAERLRMEENGIAERLRVEEEVERLRAKKEYEADLRRHEEEMAAEKLRLEEEEFNREVEQMEADRIARALKRAAQAEKKRLEQMEFEKRAQDRRADATREMEKAKRLEEERFEAERFEAERLENQRLETRRFEEEESRRQETFRRQELERKARETADNLMREQEERELLAREQERLEDERIAEQSWFEEQRRLSQQRRIDAEAEAEMERQNAQARADEEAAEAAEAAFEKEEEIRKAEEKMRKAFAAMAAEKGGIPIVVPSVLPALFPAGQNSLRKKKETSDTQPEGISQPFRQNALMPRPSIKGGLPTGPRGGASPPRRNPSIDQKLPAFQRTSPQRPSISEEAIMSPNRSNKLGPRPSIRGGLPNGPRAGGGGLPILRNQSVDQGNPRGNIPPVRRNQSIDQGLPGRPGGPRTLREPMFI